MENSDNRHRRLLRVRAEWPQSRYATCNKLTPPHARPALAEHRIGSNEYFDRGWNRLRCCNNERQASRLPYRQNNPNINKYYYSIYSSKYQREGNLVWPEHLSPQS
jgi:hypothetical protein